MSEVSSIAALSIATPVEGQPIPTPEEIAACRDFIYEEDPGKKRGSKVLRFGKYVVKYGGRTKFREVENMQFLTKYPQIAAPKCYGHGYLPNTEKPDHPYFYIVTGYIEGETVEAAFKDLAKPDKDLTAAEKARLEVDLKEVLRLISDQIHEIRSIPDPGYLGGVNNTPYNHHLFAMFPGNPRHRPEYSGPFATYHDFVETWMTRAYNQKSDPRWQPISRLCAKLARPIWRDHRTVFTHGDLAPKNIILTRLGTNADGSGKFRVTIIDWDLAGFYPEWWEFADAPAFGGVAPSWWTDAIDTIMPTYAKEFWVYSFFKELLMFG